MQVGPADIQELLRPSGDAAMQEAFRTLEEKVRSWVAAAEAMHESLAAQAAPALSRPGQRDDAGSNAPSVAGNSASSPNASAGPELSAADGRVTATAEQSDKSNDSADPAPNPVTAASSAMEDDERLLAELSVDKADAIRARYAYFKGRKGIRELIQELDDEADDEESLLMSLDPDIAKAVRVKYRLYNGRKTLREIIREVENVPQSSKASDKKSWWRK